MMPETVPESPDPLFYLKVISYLCNTKWSGGGMVDAGSVERKNSITVEAISL